MSLRCLNYAVAVFTLALLGTHSAHAAAPALILDYPTGGETFVVGTTQIIRVNPKTKVKPINFELSRDGGATFTMLTSITPNKTTPPSYSFTISGPASGNCIVKVSGMVKTTPVSATSAPFQIVNLSNTGDATTGNLTVNGTATVSATVVSSFTSVNGSTGGNWIIVQNTDDNSFAGVRAVTPQADWYFGVDFNSPDFVVYDRLTSKQKLTMGPGASGVTTIYGDLDVKGALSKGSGTFKIDHPLDPANKFLYHSFVESPDMKNIYDGVVTLDAIGEATVDLPSYFSALNRDFRYQLTGVGTFAPVYIAAEISGNSFKIAGGKPSMKVSWEVTGIRKDIYAQAHPVIAEVEKTGSDRGRYLYPELYNMPTTERGGTASTQTTAQR